MLTWLVLSALSIFHAIGGIALGVAVRKRREGNREEANFFLIWGGGFGGLPLIAGIIAFIFFVGEPLAILAEIAVLAVTALFVAFAPAELLAALKDLNPAAAAFAGFFLLLGVGTALVMFREDLLMGCLAAALFGGIGGAHFVRELRKMMKGQS